MRFPLISLLSILLLGCAANSERPKRGLYLTVFDPHGEIKFGPLKKDKELVYTFSEGSKYERVAMVIAEEHRSDVEVLFVETYGTKNALTGPVAEVVFPKSGSKTSSFLSGIKVSSQYYK
jgi:hypothetical protein